MAILTPHQKSIISCLPTAENPDIEFNIIDFYVKFGFKNRVTAENAFKKAIVKLISTIDDEEVKEYLNDLYIEDDFEAELNNDTTDKYWNITERSDLEVNVNKRRHDTAVNNLVIPERSPKERKIAANTTRNNIFDLSNAGPSGQSTIAFNTVKSTTSFETSLLPALPLDVEKFIVDSFKKSIATITQHDNTLKMVLNTGGKSKVFYQILSHFVEAYSLRPKLFIIAELPNFSEMDLSLSYWGRLLVLLFSDAKHIVIKSGEKKLESSTFKLDYKIGTLFKEKFYTLAAIEIGRFVAGDKVRDDHHKLIVESKVIINNIVTNFPFIDPTSIPVIVLQICGLKGDFLETVLLKKKTYVVHRPMERLRTPLSLTKAAETITYLKQLDHFKAHILNLEHDINLCINENDDKRGSFGRILGDGPLHKPITYKDWVDEKVTRL